MLKTLFIHSGTPKTGSSFLQSFFNKSSKELNECGILYPGVYKNTYQASSNVDINGQLLTRLLIYKTSKQLHEIKHKLIAMLTELFSLGENKVFLSDETLGIVNPEIWNIINDVCLSLNIKLVVFSYFREPVKHYPSHWAQLVRNHGEVKSLIEFTNTTNLPVWRNVVEIDKYVDCSYIFSYESELNRNEGLLLSAAKVLGINVQILLKSMSVNSNVNSSLSLNALTAIRLINAEYGLITGKKLNVYLTKLNTSKKLSVPALPTENAKIIYEKHRSEIEICQIIYRNNLKNLSL
jgi:hypothetical protein